jgi:exodeoxyribonuclease VII large subunit
MTLVQGGARKASPAPEIPEGALTPSELVYRARANVEHINHKSGDKSGELMVVGELFNPKPHRNGHLGFELKDDENKSESLKCFMFAKQFAALRFDADQGLRVLARGKLTISKYAELQLQVRALELVGAGAFEAAFRALKDKLDKEGLFAPERKKPLPFLPRTVGIVTSKTGEAIKDTITQLRARMPSLHIIFAETKVQGDEAVSEIADAIRRLDKSAKCDVILVVRGGGSLADLWAYNSEPVARAIANAHTPIVTGVGHEGDVTIADLVADVRASTPTDAAVRAVPMERELRRLITEREQRAMRAMRARLDRAHKRVSAAHARVHAARRVLEQPRRILERMRDALRARMEARVASERHRTHAIALRLERRAPQRVLATERARLRALADRLHPPVTRVRAKASQRIAVLAARLHAISPLAVLGRGYALVTRADDHALVRAPAQVKSGDALNVRLEGGTLKVRVDE